MVSAFLEPDELQSDRICPILWDARKYKVVELPTVTHPGCISLLQISEKRAKMKKLVKL